MSNPPPQKTFFWIIATLLITTIIIGGLIAVLIAFILGLLIKVLNLDLTLLSLQVITSIAYFIGLILGLRIGINYSLRKTEIAKNEAKKIVLVFSFFPIVLYLLLFLPIQIYLGGVKLAITIFLFAWKDIIPNLIIWLLVTFVAFYWIYKKTASEVLSPRTRIKKLETIFLVILLILIFGASWGAVIISGDEFRKMIGDLTIEEMLELTQPREEYEKQLEKKYEEEREKLEKMEWKTYEGNEYTINYPSYWHIIEETKLINYVSFGLDPESGYLFPLEEGNIWLMMDTFLLANLRDQSFYSLEKVNINGKTFYKEENWYYYESLEEVEFIYRTVNEDGSKVARFYFILEHVPKDKIPEKIEFIHQILSTFRFLE